jgi:hypothetical protein
MIAEELLTLPVGTPINISFLDIRDGKRGVESKRGTLRLPIKLGKEVWWYVFLDGHTEEYLCHPRQIFLVPDAIAEEAKPVNKPAPKILAPERPGSVKKQIRFLTLHRPWGYAFTKLDKTIENRSMPCHLPLGSFIALHHGKKWDEDGMGFITDLQAYEGKPLPDWTPENVPEFEVIAIARFDGYVEKSDNPWFFGPYAWKLKNIVEIEPVKNVKGSQGFWLPTPSVITQVRLNYGKAIREIYRSDRAESFIRQEKAYLPLKL